MADQYSLTPDGTVQGVSINDARRVFNFGERVAELAPQQSPFFVYLSKVAKKPTNDPVFKFMEQRHQWQRRTFSVKDDSAVDVAKGASFDLVVDSVIDKYGKTVSTPTQPSFFLEGQVVAFSGPAAVYNAKITGVDIASDPSYAKLTLTALQDIDAVIADDAEGLVVGSAFAEATGAPDGWKDELYNREGYCQIFKTAIPLFSGTALSTEYRGRPDEYRRVWQEKLMEHKMDIENAMLFGVGAADEDSTGAPLRYSWGILPYTEANSTTYPFTYGEAGSTYDDFLEAMENIFHPESGNSGNKLVLASRKVISWFNKLDAGSFLGNTVPSGGYKLDIANIPGAFGHEVTRVNTIFGNLHLVQEPLLRGPYEDYAVMVDMSNVAYRPLSGNGKSRDTQIKTNIQDLDKDGRKDMVLTEAGLEISLPETHCILKWNAAA
jgi:hypothetical protein